MATTAKEQLAAKVEAMTEDEAADALRTLNDPDELTDEQRQGILEAMASMDRGEGVPHEQVMADLNAIIDGARRKAAGE
jgi:predicted transcriptional regulator